MGDPLAPRCVQGGSEALTGEYSSIVSVVPDVSGIDRVFDYIVPERLAPSVAPGVRVRVPLNGRRVSGWVVGPGGEAHLEPSRLVEIVSVSGRAVEEDVVGLTHWVAERCWGPWRAVLASASAPRVRRRSVLPDRSADGLPPGSPGAGDLSPLWDAGGGLVVIPPLESVVTLLGEVARKGPLLVVCPTLRMARLGAAALRRRGVTTAEIPDEWERAAAGVDVVLGARSAVFAPCPGIAAIVVVDEHDEGLQEERHPTWHARDVAIERARLHGVPVILTSSVPSAEAAHAYQDSTVVIGSTASWPRIVVEDLTELRVQGSMLGAGMLEAINSRRGTTLCVLNAKGGARLLRCRACRELQSCSVCSSALSENENGALECRRCVRDAGSVCVSCGRTGFAVIAGGTGLLAREIRRSTGHDVVEVSADNDEWQQGNVLVGTDVLLHRVARADTVVFCDVDRDMLSPHLSASRDVLARLVRAARIVGAEGRIVVQTRLARHPLMEALGSGDVPGALSRLLAADLGLRATVGLPPFSRVVRVSGTGRSSADVVACPGVQVAASDDDLLLRGTDHQALTDCLDLIRVGSGGRVRVHADPIRY